MDRLEFQVQGLTQDDLRRQRKLNGRLVLPGGVTISAGLAVAAIVYVLGSTPTAMIAGTEFRGNNVIVMVDRSGSMGGTEARLAAQLDELRAAGISVDTPYATRGFGLSPAGESDNLLYPLKQALEQNRVADAVYVFSDFSANPEWAVDGSDEAGYQELRQMVTERRLRLYLGTVDQEPSPDFVAIARGSGGSIIKSK